MKRLRILSILATVGLLLGCGGGQPVNDQPAHLTEGMQAMQQGVAAYQRGCYRQSLEHFLRAHEYFAVSDQLDGVAMSLNNIGNVYRHMGEAQSARLFFDEAIRTYRILNDNTGVLQALTNKAALLIHADQLEEAQATLQQAETLAGSSEGSAGLLNTRGVLLFKQNRFDQAEEVLTRGLANTSSEDLRNRANLNYSLGRLMMATQRPEAAHAYLETALNDDRQQGFHKGIADDLSALGHAYKAQAAYATAADFFQRSIKIYALIGNRTQVDTTMQQLEEVATRAGLDIQVTRHFVTQWLAGEIRSNLCR